MTAKTESGFTVVEVVLFLAITGMLFAALMIGVNSAVTQQRYLDGVRSFKALVQSEFSEVMNTNNQPSGTASGCTATGATTGTRGTRGASDCVILGRAITIDGSKVVTAPVTARDKTSEVLEGKSDLDALEFYAPQLSENGLKETEIEWGAQLTAPSSASSLRATVLILRSPMNGTVHVFTTFHNKSVSLPQSALRTLINSSAATTELRACIDGDSGTIPKQMVTVSPRISGPDAVAIVECQS